MLVSRSPENVPKASAPLLPPWCQQQQGRPRPSSDRGVRALRAHETSRPCAKAYIAVNERHASSTIAQRRSVVMQWMETSCSSANPWAFTRGPRLPREPNSLKIVMDKFPSIEVLSRYTHPLLPTCCQHRAGAFGKETRHATGRPAVSDHSGAPAHTEAFDGGRDRGRAGDLEADHLPRYNDPDRTARADPR